MHHKYKICLQKKIGENCASSKILFSCRKMPVHITQQTQVHSKLYFREIELAIILLGGRKKLTQRGFFIQ